MLIMGDEFLDRTQFACPFRGTSNWLISTSMGSLYKNIHGVVGNAALNVSMVLVVTLWNLKNKFSSSGSSERPIM